MAKELKNRNEMDPRWQWRLDHIFASDEAYEQAYAKAQSDIEKRAAWQGRVHENPRQAVRDADALSVQFDHLAAYALMHKDEDSGDPERQARAAKFQSLAVKAEAATSFLNPELLALPEAELRAMAEDP